MMKWLIGIVLAVALAVPYAQPTAALSLKMQPLIYRDTLGKGEQKKGFIDVSNPTGEKLRLRTSVQAFRQVDDNGSLQFFDEPQIAAGIKSDLDEFELGPREAIRLYFLIDGTKLPSGDVFGALFVSTVSSQKSGSVTSVRLGTLFVLTNGTPGSRDGKITDFDVAFWQLGDGINGTFSIKNTARPGSATGFFPSTLVAIEPLRQQSQVDSKLVFAGRTRQSDFQLQSSRLGFYKVSVQYGDSKQEKWVFMMTGYWRAIVAIAVLLAVAALIWWHKQKRRSRQLKFKRK